MNRNLKALGAALAAVLALGAAGTASASAEEFFFLSEAESTTLKGTQHETTNDVFTTTAGTVECAEATFSGSLKGFESSSFEVSPVYSGCTSSGSAATFEMNECKYRFNNGNIEGESLTGTVDIVCPTGKEIIVKVTTFGVTCTINVPAQTGLGTVTYKNVGENSSTQITPTLKIESKIKYSHKGTFCGTGSAETGSYTGGIILKGESGGEQQGVDANKTIWNGMVLKPTQLNFKTLVKGEKTTVTVENTTDLIIRLGKHTIHPDENDFKVVPGGTCVVDGTAKSDLKAKTSCTATVEFLSGKLNVTLRWYVLKFGPRGNAQLFEKKVDVFS